MDTIYIESEDRKNVYVIECSRVGYSFMSTCGLITYKRTYFKDKKTGAYKYMVDEACSITKNMPKSQSHGVSTGLNYLPILNILNKSESSFIPPIQFKDTIAS